MDDRRAVNCYICRRYSDDTGKVGPTVGVSAEVVVDLDVMDDGVASHRKYKIGLCQVCDWLVKNDLVWNQKLPSLVALREVLKAG